MLTETNYGFSAYSVEMMSHKKSVFSAYSSYTSTLYFDIFGLFSGSFLNSNLWHSQPA